MGNFLEIDGDLDLVFMLGDLVVIFLGVFFFGVLEFFLCGVGFFINCESKKEEFLLGDLKRVDWYGGFFRMLFRVFELFLVFLVILFLRLILVWVRDFDFIKGFVDDE